MQVTCLKIFLEEINLMTTIIKSLLIFLLFTPFLNSQDKASGISDKTFPKESSEEKIVRYNLNGLKMIYSERFDDAIAYYDSSLALDKNNLRSNLYKSTVFMWDYIVNKNQNDFKDFFKLTDDILKVTEQRISQNRNDTEALAILGALYGYRSMIHTADNNYLKSAWAGKRSYDYLKVTIANNPEAIESYLGMGIFNYTLGSLDSKIKPLISFIGMKGDKQTGLEQLTIAKEQGVYTKYEAKFFLSQFVKYYDKDVNLGNEMLDNFLAENPEFTLFRKLDEKKVFSPDNFF